MNTGGRGIVCLENWGAHHGALEEHHVAADLDVLDEGVQPQ